jgi:hypothetical protein
MKRSRAEQRDDNQVDRARVLEVRIHFPPPVSQQTFGSSHDDARYRLNREQADRWRLGTDGRRRRSRTAPGRGAPLCRGRCGSGRSAPRRIRSATVWCWDRRRTASARAQRYRDHADPCSIGSVLRPAGRVHDCAMPGFSGNRGRATASGDPVNAGSPWPADRVERRPIERLRPYANTRGFIARPTSTCLPRPSASGDGRCRCWSTSRITLSSARRVSLRLQERG